MRKRSFLEDFFDGMNDKLFILLIIFVQVIFIFQGLDFTDSGFDADFYSRIFSDPSTVQYSFMYWFTGILGGLWLKIFPGFGLLGLRFAGVMFTTITFLITYDLLKKFLHTAPLRLSLLLIILFLTTSVKEVNQDDVSALFFMCAVWFLYTGLSKEKNYKIFLAGAFISLNTFSRLPNLFGMILIMTIWFAAYLNRDSIRLVIYRSFLFISGFIGMSFCLIVVMKLLHHDQIFQNYLKLAGQMEGNLENAGSFFPLLKIYIFHYAKALSVAMLVLMLLWSLSAAWRRIITDLPGTIPFLPVIKYGILVILTLICIYQAGYDPDFWIYLLLFYTGLSLIVGFLIVTGRQPKNLRILAAIGCIMLLVLPVGNDLVLATTGKYACWIIVPVTVDFLLNIRALSSRIVVSENSRHSYEQVFDEKLMTGLRNACIYLTLIFIISITYYYPHFDRTNRVMLRFPVRNHHMEGIYTSESRARVINELLAVSSRYVKKDDYVLAYDCIPMYYYMTDTRPFMHNSWLRLYDDEVFRKELSKSIQETHICPVVILQKRSTIGNNWPDNREEIYEFRPAAMAHIREFLKTYQYTQVWENDFFRIYVPADKNAAVAENFTP